MGISDGRAVTEKELPGGMSFDQIHRGLPDETPWFFRTVLAGRRFLIVTLVTTALLGVIAANNPEWLLRIDKPVSEWVRGWEGSLLFAKVVTSLGSPNLVIGVGLIAVAFLWRRCRASALTLVALVAAALTVDTVLKVIVDRARPPNPTVSTMFGSFPSGHVTHAVIIFGLVPFLLWILTNRPAVLRLGFVVFAVVVLFVAWSRVRLGAHWPSDVIASLFIGASLLLGAEQLLTSTWSAERCAMLGHHPTFP